MEGGENIVKTLDEAWYIYLAIGCAIAWVAFAEHPDAKRLKTATLDTLGLL